jgi:hypothetical protein
MKKLSLSKCCREFDNDTSLGIYKCYDCIFKQLRQDKIFLADMINQLKQQLTGKNISSI